MGLFSKDIATLDDLFVHTLQDIYYAENQISKALPTMIAKATNPQLKQGFQRHLTETQNQIKRLERVFEMHGHSPKGVDCPAIDGIIKEANEVAGEVDDKEVLDAALIASAQAVEHYEITRYGTLIAWAQQLGRDDCASVLRQNLNEEKATDRKLTAMAEGSINREANTPDDDWEEHQGRHRHGVVHRYVEHYRDHDWGDRVGLNTFTVLAGLGSIGLLAAYAFSGSGQDRGHAARSGRRSAGSSFSHDIDALEALTSTLTDSIDGYEEAAEVASNSGISAFLREKAQERRAITSEFRNRLAIIGGDSQIGGSTSAALHRRFLDLRSMFQNDTKAAIAEVERGEGYLQQRFETCMADTKLSAATRDLIRSTYARVRFDHDRWNMLKQAQAAV